MNAGTVFGNLSIIVRGELGCIQGRKTNMFGSEDSDTIDNPNPCAMLILRHDFNLVLVSLSLISRVDYSCVLRICHDKAFH